MIISLKAFFKDSKKEVEYVSECCDWSTGFLYKYYGKKVIILLDDMILQCRKLLWMVTGTNW